MRVVIDTNVFVSAAIREKSFPAMVVFFVIDKHQLLMSETTRLELLNVLERPKLSRFLSKQFVAWLSKAVSIIETTMIEEPIVSCRDQKDNQFLKLAVNGRADVIVSGDNDLLVMHPFRNIPILTPAQFLEREN